MFNKKLFAIGLSVLIVIFFVVGCHDNRESKVLNEMSLITERYERPTMSASELETMLLKIEKNESKYTDPPSASVGGARYSLASMFWDWDMPEQAWQLVSKFQPPVGCYTSHATDFVLYLGVALHKSKAELNEVLKTWKQTDMKQNTYLSQSSVEALMNHNYSEAFDELSSKYTSVFDEKNLRNPMYEINPEQFQWFNNAIYLLHAYASEPARDEKTLAEASKIIERIYGIFSVWPYEDNKAWTDVHYQSAYYVIWALYLGDLIKSPPYTSSGKSVWHERLDEVLKASPPNVLVTRRFASGRGN